MSEQHADVTMPSGERSATVPSAARPSRFPRAGGSGSATGRPRRIQLRRTKGWRKPEGAIVVSRPTRWGNPWTAAECAINGLESGRDLAYWYFRQAMDERLEDPDYLEHEKPSWYPPLDDIRAELGGRDLACWCSESRLCHADVLLEIANS